MSDVSDRVYDPYDGYRRPVSLSDVRFAYGVQQPVNYRMMDARYETRSRTNVRAAPNVNSRVVTQLRTGEDFDALARVNGGWLLVGLNGEAVGYVREDIVMRTDVPGELYSYGTTSGRRMGSGQLCRTFDQTVSRYGYPTTTERYTACQTARGEWVLQS